ncbi:AAA family ATPase [Micromonospora zamorensis]|uniref:AAA family ATPase n=1 Tax=Micromonospora zamorensis TaxID=709883 RepID=UPI003689DA3D
MSASRKRSPGTFLVLEGYDGSGKSTLIDAVRSRLASASIRVVGRKTEPELADISKILEREDLRPDPGVEMLLRIASEVERLRIITRSLFDYDLVVCDRGMISMLSWFDYLGVLREPYEPILYRLYEHHRGALTIVCRADFETCWARSSRRSEQSRKDRLGKDLNRQYFAAYGSNVEKYAASASGVAFIDTVENDVERSSNLVLQTLQSSGFWVPGQKRS